MKFIVSSSQILYHLQSISKVVGTKSTMPVLENFLFEQKGNVLNITASDIETTMNTSFEPDACEGEGSIALPARILLEILKKFPEQPITFDINLETLKTSIISDKGNFSINGIRHDEFPEFPIINNENSTKIMMPANVLLNGINKTYFASAEDELRPVMNGIFLDIKTDGITFVASDTHKLIKYKRTDVKFDNDSSFILPKKPATLLKSILTKEEDFVEIEFDDKNAFVKTPNFIFTCCLIEGKYPEYDNVIPDNPNKVIMNRQETYNSIGRVSLFSSEASKLIKLTMDNDNMEISAQDIDFSISGQETIGCEYSETPISIGFKSSFLEEILDNISSEHVVMAFIDTQRGVTFYPLEKEENIEELMLLMPMMV